MLSTANLHLYTVVVGGKEGAAVAVGASSEIKDIIPVPESNTAEEEEEKNAAAAVAGSRGGNNHQKMRELSSWEKQMMRFKARQTALVGRARMERRRVGRQQAHRCVCSTLSPSHV